MADDNDLTAEEQAQLDAERAGEAAAADDTQQPPPDNSAQEGGAQSAGEEGGEGDAAAQQQQPRMVDHAALVEERERRREIEKRAQEADKRATVAEERLNLILQRAQQNAAQQQGDPQTPQIPDFAQDPVGHLAARLQHSERALAQVAGYLGQQRQQGDQERNMRALEARAVALEGEFRAKTPDYDDAVRHLITGRHRELEMAGYRDPAERQLILAEEARMLVAKAMQDGSDPAQMTYEIAKLRGYAPAQGQQQPQAPSATDRMQTIARGQQQARTLSTVSGAEPNAITGRTVANWSDAEFEKWLEKATPEQLQAVMGA